MRLIDDTWGDKQDRAYRAEIERRFRERTPPAKDDIYSFDPRNRVGRGEMRTWAMDTFGEHPPETDDMWVKDNARWYWKMSKRVRKELGEDD